jgi:hypothetical protein
MKSSYIHKHFILYPYMILTPEPQVPGAGCLALGVQDLGLDIQDEKTFSQMFE